MCLWQAEKRPAAATHRRKTEGFMVGVGLFVAGPSASERLVEVYERVDGTAMSRNESVLISEIIEHGVDHVGERSESFGVQIDG